MYCNKCGSELENSSKFCNKCGAPVKTADEDSATMNSAAVSVTSGTNTVPSADPKDSRSYRILKKRTKKNLIGSWIFLFISIILLIPGIIMCIITYNSVNPKNFDTLTEDDLGILPTYAEGSIYRVLDRYQDFYLIMLPATDCYNFSVYDDPMQLTEGVGSLRSGVKPNERRVVFLDANSCSNELRDTLDRMISQQKAEGGFGAVLARFIMPERTDIITFEIDRINTDKLFHMPIDSGKYGVGGTGYDETGLMHTVPSEMLEPSEDGYIEMIGAMKNGDFLNGQLDANNFAPYVVRPVGSSSSDELIYVILIFIL